MRRYVLPLAALLLVAAAAAWLFLARSGSGDGRIYTVAGLLQATRRDPAAWDGTVVRVSGGIQPGLLLVRFHSRLLTVSSADRFDAYLPLSIALAGASPGYVALSSPVNDRARLWVTLEQPGGLMAALRRLPVVGGLIPEPRPLRAGVSTVYRVRLHAHRAPCPAFGCVSGTLLDYAIPAAARIDPYGDPYGDR